jgi:sugar O-acyltransferase (sialic acid O-acetyltransferase NeuD family)
MQRILILGAGGHGQVVADILLRACEAGAALAPIGFLDDNSACWGHTLLGIPILGAIDILDRIEHDALVIAIGDNVIRQQLFVRLQEHGCDFVVARHPASTLAPDVPIGKGSVICAGVVVNPGSVIGANVILNTGSTIDHNNVIADHVHVAPGVHLGGNVQIDQGALLGIGSTVMPARRVGAWSTVGACSLVYQDIPHGVVAFGVPAKIVRSATQALAQTEHSFLHTI